MVQPILINDEETFKGSKHKVGNRDVNYSDFISAYCIHALKYHTVLHKEAFYVLIDLKNIKRWKY